MIKIAFFDIDDTLIGYTRARDKALDIIGNKYFPQVNKQIFAKVWIEETARYWNLFTKGKITFAEQRLRRIKSIWNAFGKKANKKEIDNIVDSYVSLFESNWKTFAGIKKSLNTLRKKGIKLGVITNGNWVQQQKKLKQVKLHSFFEEDYIFVSEKIGTSKPDLGIFKHAQLTSGFKANEIVYFGNDLDQDIVPGKKMNWTVVHVTSPKILTEWILNF